MVYRSSCSRSLMALALAFWRCANPHQQCYILMLAAPPCPDFSSINQSAESFQGQEGSKFDKYIDFSTSLEQKLEGWVKNVVMQTTAETQHVSHGLKAEPVVIDACDLGIISRRRLWWTRRRWSASDLHPVSGHPLDAAPITRSPGCTRAFLRLKLTTWTLMVMLYPVYSG